MLILTWRSHTLTEGRWPHSPVTRYRPSSDLRNSKLGIFRKKLSVAMTTRIIFETDGEINNWFRDRFDGFQKTPH